MTELVETIYHWHQGQSISGIAKSLGLSRNTVKKYVKIGKQAGIRRDQVLPDRGELARVLGDRSDLGHRDVREAPAQGLLRSYHDQISVWFDCKDITAKQIWRLLSEQYQCQVGYTSVKRYLREHFSFGQPPVTVRIETPAGRQAQVDYGYAGMLFDPETQRMRKAWAFIMVLSFSRHRFVRFVFSQDSSSWIDCHRRAFEFFEGVPETVVLDNLKSGVIKPDIFDPTINRAYADCERYYGFVADPAKARMPQHKGKVERQVSVVRQQVLAGRNLSDIVEANKFGLVWCREGIGMEVNGTTQRRPYELFREAEQAVLKPLPQEPFEPAVWKECTVHPDHYVFFEKSFYSMPSRFIGRKVWVRGSSRQVQIFDAERLIKTHLPAPHPGYRRTDPTDLPAEKLAYVMPEPTNLRLQAQEIGDHAHELVDLLLKQHSFKNLRKVHSIIRLREKYGQERLDAACGRALSFGNFKLEGLKSILELGLEDRSQQPEVRPPTLLSEQGQSFIRPGAYYAGASVCEEGQS